MPKYYQNYNKKSLQTISKANYLRQFMLPHRPDNSKGDANNILKFRTGNKDQAFFFIDQQQVQTQVNVTPGLLLNSLKKIYPSSNSSKIDSHSFVNTHEIKSSSLIGKTTEFQQLIDIVIVQRGSSEGSQSQTSRRTYIKIASMTNLEKTQKQSKDYEAYIVHFMYAPDEKQPIKWDTFVEKYQFRNLSEQESQPLTKISYSMIFSYTNSTIRSYSFLNFVSSNNNTKDFLHKSFDAIKGNEQRLKKLQSYLFHLNQLKSETEEDTSFDSKMPCYSPELKRQRKIPPEHFMEYKKLKDKTLKSYKTLNKSFIENGSIKDVQMKVENMVCRFLIEHDYNFEKTSRELTEFLTFESDLRKNFTLKSFKYWLDQDIISRIGFDKIGRPVILFKTYNFLAQKCHDVSDYMNFLFYYILIETMSVCRGYIDEMILLADCSNNTMKNMKIQVNRRMVPTGLKYCPRMFFKLIPFKSTAIPYYAYTLAKPLLPSYSNEIIVMIKQGDDKGAFDQCMKWMDIQIIPQVIGGKNKDCKDISQKNLSTRDE